MAKTRIGYTFEGNLYPGRLRLTSRRDLKEALLVPAVPGHIDELVLLMPVADLAIFPLWPGRERAHFIAMWLKRRFYERFREHPRDLEVVEDALSHIEICDRRPDDLDICVDYTAPLYDGATAFSWPHLKEGMQRGWDLDGRHVWSLGERPAVEPVPVPK